MKKILLVMSIMLSFILFGNSNKDIDTMKLKWKEYLLNVNQGINLKEVSVADRAENIRKVDESADKVLANLAIHKTNEYILENYKDMTHGDQLWKMLMDIEKVIIAYQTPGSKYYKNEEIKKDIVDSIQLFSDKGYYAGGEERLNWWQWEIGIPKVLNEVLVIAEEIIPEATKVKLLQASRFYQPSPYYSGISPAAAVSSNPRQRLSLGGNRTDTALVSFGRGIIDKNPEEIREAIDSVAEVAKYVKKAEGFYQDGSFIQHVNVAYNGTYGAVLLEGISTFMYLTANTEFQINNPYINNLYDVLTNAYSYLLINGGINDSVNGRSVSRDDSSDIDRAKSIISSIALISEGASKEYKPKLQALVKKAILDNNAINLVEKSNSLVVKNLLNNIVNDKKIEKLEVEGVKVFGAMDRAIQVGKSGGKFVIAMHSKRIANYETMNKENLKGWYSGDGMTYIYGNDSSNFIEYWPTVNQMLLPGTTESTKEREKATGERRDLNKVSSKVWVGGVSNSKVGLVGMDYSSWNDMTTAKKSWLLLGDEVIALGSNISSQDGDILTVIDNRKINEEDMAKVYANGNELQNSISLNKKGDYVIYENDKKNENIGYILLENQDVNARVVDRKGTWKEVGGTSDKEINKKFLELVINHGQNPTDGKYGYVVLPNFSKESIKKYNLNNIEILRQDDMAHIFKIKDKNILAINSWTNKEVTADGITLNATVALIRETTDKGVNIYISDPTHTIETNIIVKLDGSYKLAEKIEGVSVSNVGNKTILGFKLLELGQTLKIALVKK